MASSEGNDTTRTSGAEAGEDEAASDTTSYSTSDTEDDDTEGTSGEDEGEYEVASDTTSYSTSDTEDDDTEGTSEKEEGKRQAASVTSAKRASDTAPATKCDATLLLVGKTGVGKSATGNSILNLKWNPFTVDSTDTSVTENCQFEYSRYQERTIKVVDMPGLSDGSKDKEEDIKNVEKEAITAVSETPDGYNAVLVVVREGRQSKEDMEVIDNLKKIFGKKVIHDFGILVVTYGDNFKRQAGQTQTLDEYCSTQKGTLKKIWEECNRRAVLFDNVTKSVEEKQSQLKQLFDFVDAMRGKGTYNLEMFKAAKEKRDELIAKEEDLVLTDGIKSTLRLLLHDQMSVTLKIEGESIAHLENIKARVQTFIAETQKQEGTVKKIKDVLSMAENIQKATENKIKLASLMKPFLDKPANSEMPLEKAKELKSQKKIVEKNDVDLYEQYEQLLQKDIPTKVIIVAAAALILEIGIPVATGVIGGAVYCAITGASGKAVLPFVAEGVSHALKAVPLSAIPGIKKLKKAANSNSKSTKCPIL